MQKSWLDTPSPIDLMGLPKGDYFTHEFPADVPAARSLQLILNDIDKKLINFSGDSIKPDKHPKQLGRLARHTEIALNFSHKIIAIKLFLNLNAKIIFVLGRRDSSILTRPEILKPTDSQLTTYYNGNKKRVLNACFFGPGHPVTEMNLAMASCEAVIAIDTNSQNIPGIGKVSATTAIEADIKIISEDACHMLSGAKRQAITINSPGKNPEIVGIGTMMNHFFNTNPKLNGKKVGIITDTELGLIRGMNNRTIPFYESMLLPENIDLFYATSDSGSTEFMANKLIRMCDIESKEYLANYLKGQKLHDL